MGCKSTPSNPGHRGRRNLRPKHGGSSIYIWPGAPSQLELFEHKPELQALHGQDCPQQFLEGKRFAFIRGVPQLLGPVYPFEQVGEAGFWISDRLPHFKQRGR